jgi:lipoprotein LpqH
VLVNHGVALAAAGCTVLIAGLTGCSSDDAGSGQGRVVLGGKDAGAVTAVTCTKDGDRTTLTLDGDQKTTVVLSGPDTVESVNVGEIGSDAASLAYVQGVSGTPAKASKKDNGYSISGTGQGSDPAHPDAPVDTPFEIEVTCP